VRAWRAKFLAVEDEEFKNAQTAGGYAKEMSRNIKPSRPRWSPRHIKKQDVGHHDALSPAPGAAG